ncbi:MAG: hypothetical protein WEA09_01120 [Gemmatimonadota bacterium]
MKHLTIRNVPPKLAQALQEARRRSGTSLNQTVLDLLQQGLGVGQPRSNGLSELAGGWSEDDFLEFQEAVAPFSQIDPELWS